MSPVGTHSTMAEFMRLKMNLLGLARKDIYHERF